MAALNTGGTVAFVFLSVEALIMLLVVLVVCFLLVRGMSWVLAKVKMLGEKGLPYFRVGHGFVTRIMNVIAAPFIAVGAVAAFVRGVASGIRRQFA